MRTLFASPSFQKDLKLAAKRNKSMKKMQTLLDLLLEDKRLPERCRLHKLSGNYNNLWECHIEPDWLLIFGKTDTEILLYRTGTHADLFR